MMIDNAALPINVWFGAVDSNDYAGEQRLNVGQVLHMKKSKRGLDQDRARRSVLRCLAPELLATQDA